MCDQHVAPTQNTTNAQEMNKHALSCIRTHSRSKEATAHLHVMPHGHRDRGKFFLEFLVLDFIATLLHFNVSPLFI